MIKLKDLLDEASDFKKAHKKFKETGELPPHLKKLVKDLDKVKVKHKVKNIVVPGLEWMADIDEGSCGYGIDGKVGKKPAGPHLLKKKKKILKSRVHEAPGKNHKDEYVGTARVKVEPYTYKNQVRNFHDVSMYRDHKKPYHYYLSIRLAHSDGNKIDHVVDTGTHILKKAGKWAQGFIKRRMSGTGNERFS